jgi:hypothetical protein
LAGAALPVSRTRFDHFTTVEGAISYLLGNRTAEVRSSILLGSTN